MSFAHRAWIVSAIGGVTWLIASAFCTSLAECCYRTIPLVALTVYLSGLQDIRLAWQTQIRPALSRGVGLLIVAMGVAGVFFGLHAILSWRVWLEVASALYFLAAAVILLLTVRRLLLAGARAIYDRCKLPPVLRMISCDIVPLVVFVFFALPFGMAFSHVHRFKLPNLVDPKQGRGRDFEEVEFPSTDGTPLRGWWIPAKTPSTRTLVLCHGIAGNRTVVLPFTEVGDWLDANVLVFDLRGHGESGGRTVTLGFHERADALAAIAYVRREKPEQARQVIGMGTSLGAATMALAAAEVEPPLDGVILDSSFTSTRDMTAKVMDGFPAFSHGWLLTLGLPIADWHAGCPITTVSPEASIHRLRAPVAFLHSRGDPVIPSAHSVRLHQQAAEPKLLHIFELPGHCDAFFAQRDPYRAAVRSLESMLQK